MPKEDLDKIILGLCDLEFSSARTSMMMDLLPTPATTFGSWIIFTTVILGVLILLIVSRAPKNLPPGPRGLPIIGALHLLGKDPSQDLARLAKVYGPVMSLWLGQQLTVVASSPAAAEEILKTQGPSFSGRADTSFARIVLPDDIAVASDSPARLHMKKILHIQLSTARQVHKSASLRAEEITRLLTIIPQDGQTVVPVRTYIGVAFTNILSLLLLKKRFMALHHADHEALDAEVEQVEQFRTLIENMTEYGLELDLGDLIPAFKWVDVQGLRKRLWSLRERMDAFASRIISEHLAQRKNDSLQSLEKDLLDVLLDQMEDESLKFDITMQHVTSAFWDIFAAGTDTSTHAVEWALSECIRNPTVMRKAQSELDEVVGTARRVEDSDIPDLKYLQALCKESFRLHPASTILPPHMNPSACKLFGYDIPAKTMVMVSIGTIARDPSIWEDPLVFRPERFLDSETDFQGQHFEYLPFGSGRRQCPGMALGVTMVHLMIASLLQSFEWSLPDAVLPVDLDMTPNAGFGPWRAQPLNAILKPRLSIVV